MKLLLLASLVTAGALLGAGPAAASTASIAPARSSSHAQTAAQTPARTKVIRDCVHARVAPRKIVSACADGGAYAIVTRYDSWHANRATGIGRLVVNDCRPSCVAGHFHSYPATFRLHDVVQTARGPRFAKLGVTYVKHGEQHDTELPLPTRPL